MTTRVINSHKVEDDTAIRFKSNPKRPGFKAHKRYETYSAATTVAEYFELAEKKYATADLRYDEEHGHLEILDADGQVVNIKEEADK